MTATTTPRLQAQHPADNVAGQPLALPFTVVLAVLLAGATIYGLLAAEPYRVSTGVRPDLPAVLKGQDLLTLLTIPVLLWTAVRARAGSFPAYLVWLGLLLYYAYSYVTYAFSPFNDVFLLYVAVIGCSSFGLLSGLVRMDAAATRLAFQRTPRRRLAWFLIAVGGLFVALWLAMILPAIPGGLPAGRATYDIASAVHVLDLSFVLPLLIGTGVMLLRRHPIAPALAAILLTKMVTLGLAMLAMGFVFADARNIGEAALWAGIAAISAAWLTAIIRRLQPVHRWLHPSLWT